MLRRLSSESTDFKFALAKYATLRKMSCFGNADATVNYMDNQYQHGGSGLNLLNLALSKMVLKQFEKRPDDRKDDTAKVSFTFGYFLFWSDCVINKFRLSALSLTFIRIDIKKIENLGKIKTKGPFLEGPKKFFHPKSRSKISNLMTTELFYAQILNMNRGSRHARSFRRIQLFVFKYRLTKNGFSAPKSFWGFRDTGPRFDKVHGKTQSGIQCADY